MKPKPNPFLHFIIIFIFSLCITFTNSLNQQGIYLYQAKLTLYDPTNALSNWNPGDSNPCNWIGVTCDSSKNEVFSISLSNFSLWGPFPIILCQLPYLTQLTLSYNNLNSSLPETISNCSSLTHLDLEQNLFTGDIPLTLPHISNLGFLNLEGNSFTGEIPRSFRTFRNLLVLNLVNNLLSGTVIQELGNVTSLRELRLAYNPFSPSELPKQLGNLVNLETLWVSECNLIGEIPGSLSSLGRLVNFDVSDNMLTGKIPSFIFNWKNIQQIELFNNSFYGEIPEKGWGNITALRRFDVSVNGLTGKIPEGLCKLPLGSLNLEDNFLVGEIPESIAKSPNLYELKVFNNSLNGILPNQLGRHSRLNTIDVSSNNFSGELPPYLCEKGALEELLLIYNSFSGTIPEVYGKCTTLNRVRFRGNQFSGELPGGFWGLPHLSFLDIGENSFSGNIPSSISGALNLSTLYLSYSNFSGNLPEEIGSLIKLIELSASDNEFSGPIPSSIVNLSSLARLDLGNNRLSGEIPNRFELLKQLNELNLANNSLSGDIPEEIGSFPVLNYLDLSDNQFSGEIPLGLQDLKLNTLNLSYNRLKGEIPPLYKNDAFKNSFLGNPSLCHDINSACNWNSRNNNRSFHLWIIRSVLTVLGLMFLVALLLIMWQSYKLMKDQEKNTFIMKWKSFHTLDFSESDIANSLIEDNIIGTGGSGKVYKAVLENGEIVAVKKLNSIAKNNDDDSIKSIDAFETEVETLGKIRHKNIVRLWCCCNSGDCKLLVYEYMPNGSLGDLLHSNKGKLLDWPTRFRIALDSAEGLSYLHHDCVPPIVHRDVKSNNILLDEDFRARISDFGVAKIVHTDTVNMGVEAMSSIAGSCGYIAPEYAYTLRVNEKSDIYSFGIVILELLTGKCPGDPELGEKDLVTYVCSNLDHNGVAVVLDQNLEYSVFKEQICKVLEIGLNCVSSLPINRPSMRRVVKMLKEAGAASVNKPLKKDANESHP